MSELMKKLDDESKLANGRMRENCYAFCETLIIYPSI
jgi:hypothetical protein